MEVKDKDNLKGKLKKCLRETSVYLFTDKDHKIIFPIFGDSLAGEIFDLVSDKLKHITTIYERMDIQHMIFSKIAAFLNYDQLQGSIPQNENRSGFNLVLIGELPKFLNESKFNDIVNNVIEELDNPTKSYILVKLPSIEVHENIKINDNIFLISDIHDYFKIADNEKQYFHIQLKRNVSYLLIAQPGWNYRFIRAEQSLVYQNILREPKVFLGLSMITDILDKRSLPQDNQDKRIVNITIGVFSSVEWYEGIPDDTEEPIPEDHPEFEDIRDLVSQGDSFRRFCFQKRFFIEDEIHISQSYANLLDSLCIADCATKPSFDLIENLIDGTMTTPLPHFEKLESSEQYLNKRFHKISMLLNSDDNYAKRIKAASLWYLEGYCADNDAYKFINYTIAIECLLGGGHKENISERLSDRYGFSLGKNLKDREDKKNFFKKIYTTRSSIVHEGKPMLTKKEYEILHELEKATKSLINEAITTYE